MFPNFVLTYVAEMTLFILCFSFKDRFLSSLPASRRASADFTRPIFTAVAFYLCAKKHKVSLNV